MSQLEVDKIIPQSGTTLTIGDSGDTITFGTGTTPQLGGDLSTNGNDINFGDNDKAQFGASNDLQIYHDGSNSYISDVGTGNLRIQATNFEVANGAYTKSYIVASDGAEVTLKYNNNNKLSTTSTGVDVTGKTTTDSIDAVGGQSGSTPIVKIENSVGDNLVSFKRTTGTPSDEFAIGADSASLHFKNSTLSTYIMSLSEGGDISFYEDTGTTPKLFWDASAESLGVGTSSPSSFNQYADNLVVGTTSGDNGITIASGTANSGRFVFSDNTTSSASAFVGAIEYSHTSDAMIFYTSASEAMRIDSSGRLLVGTTSTTINTSNFGFVFDANTDVFKTSRNTNGGGTSAEHFGNAGQIRFMGDGDAENTNNSYGALSDRTLKENEIDANSQWNDIKALQIKNYNLIEYPDRPQIGVIAQDLEDAGMNGLVKTDDEGLKSVKYSVLYMKAVKALQEAMLKIEDLEARVNTLEGN
jgi:hypothetical protein